MAEPNYYRKQGLAFGNPESKKRVLLLHGYTGGLNDFGNLGEILAGHDIFVWIPLLPGHGSKVEDLSHFRLIDFLESAEIAYNKIVAPGTKIVIGGNSFGGHLALLLAATKNPHGVFTTVAPYVVRFPLSNWFFQKIFAMRKYWKKRIPKNEILERKNVMYYDKMPSKGLRLTLEANIKIRQNLTQLKTRALHLHSLHDRLALAKSGEALSSLSPKTNTTVVILKNGHHAIFYSKEREEVIKKILNFVEECFKD